jgi:hypothetical protein
MKQIKRIGIALALWIGTYQAYADEGMWVLKELNEQNRARMEELGFASPMDRLYSDSLPCAANAVVIFGEGCTGITVSEEGLVFTNHHCGFGSLQKLSSVTNDYMKDGFVSQTRQDELPVPGLTVRYLKEMVDVSERIVSRIDSLEATDESDRLHIVDSISRAICDSIQTNEFLTAEVLPFYNQNKYYLVVYDVYRDVRLVFAPPSSVSKFGGDTDNWMWPRHTGDFSVFRVYANDENRPAAYDTTNRPYHPTYVAEISLQGYAENDYAITLGFPGSTDRYLCSWGVEQRIENRNKPRIEVRGIKQDIWKKAMLASNAIHIKYASKYAGSSNYWKNAIGMNRGVKQLNVVDRKKVEEKAFAAWVAQTPERKAVYGDVLDLLEKGYAFSGDYDRFATYLIEAFLGGTEVIRLARMVGNAAVGKNTPDEVDQVLKEQFRPFFKDYEPSVDQHVLAAMMKIVKERVPTDFLPDIYRKIDKKYKGNYAKYAADLFKRSSFLTYESVEGLLRDKKSQVRIRKYPATELSSSVLISLFDIQMELNFVASDIDRAERLYLAGLQEMYPERNFYSDANFTLRLSYGSIGGYQPFDAAWYNYYSTEKGILEKNDETDEEFWLQPEIVHLLEGKDFAPYANPEGELQVCFLTNNDITGGNSGSPIFDKHTRLIGLAFDGNWEAMSGDLTFEPKLQRCIGVDIRYVLYLIDKWGKCPRLINELKLVK